MTSRPRTRVSVQAPFRGVSDWYQSQGYREPSSIFWLWQLRLFLFLWTYQSRVWDPLFHELSLSVLFLLRSRLHQRWGRLQLPNLWGCSSLILIHRQRLIHLPPPVAIAPMVSPFMCLDDSESDTEIPKRHVSPTPHEAMLTRWRSRVTLRSSSPTTSIPKIPTAPILPAPSAIVVVPSSEFPLTYVVAPPERDSSMTSYSYPTRGQWTMRKLVGPLPSQRLALRYTSHHLDHFTSGSSSSHSSSNHSSYGHSISGHSLSGHRPPDTIDDDSSTPPKFVHPSLARTLPGNSSSESSVGPSRKRCRSPAAILTSSIHATRALVPLCADIIPPRKRFRDSISPEDSIEEDIDTDVLEDIEADVDVVVDVEDEVEDEVESSDRGTMEVGVDVVARIDIPDAMLMPDVLESLEQGELQSRSVITGGERASLLEQNMTITRSGMTPEAIKELVNRRVEEALAAYEATRAANALEAKNQSQNGSDGDNGNGGN
ncbi:hypothetical protein Tco_0554849 [Tanacetum coccineum]